MKNLLFFLISILFSIDSNAQLFDGTIFGALPGRQKDLIEYYEKKGFRTAHANGNSKETVIMEGVINGTGTSYNNMDYLIRIQKDSTDPDYVKSISLIYPKNADSLVSQMKHYQKAFINSFGLPSQVFLLIGVIQTAGLFISILGIPAGLVVAKSLGTYWNPVNKKCVPAAVSNELQRRKDEEAVKKHLG
jgi:hypothetical protein